jgi:hypothetical protein
MIHRRHLVAIAAASVAAGCSTPAPDPAPPPVPTAPTRAPQPEVCGAWMEQVGNQDPALLPQLYAQYGERGSCWAEGPDARAQCETACVAGVEKYDQLRRTPTKPNIGVKWDDEGVEVFVYGVETDGYDLGIADTSGAPDAWRGEDCLHGTPPYQRCHIMAARKQRLRTAASPDQVESGRTTLFDREDEPDMTYMVTVQTGACWVWGHDPSYYLKEAPFRRCQRL